MLKRCGIVVAALAVLSSQTGCYTTRIATPRPPEPGSHTERQWFSIGGLASLSDPAGRECTEGVSWAESKLSATDWLIDVGLGVAGGLAGALVCGATSNGTAEEALAAGTSCAGVGAWLVPFLLSSRTVEYACARPGAGARPEWMPPAAQPPAGPAAPPAPPAPVSN